MAVFFRPHCPGFVNNGEPSEGVTEFKTVDDLCDIPQVARFKSSGASLSVSRQSVGEDFLMGTMPDGTFLVIGYVSQNALQSLPDWVPPSA